MEDSRFHPRGLLVNKRRTCRDVPCCLVFILFWAGMITIATIAVQRGDPLRMYRGYDSYGNVCGRKENPKIKNVTLSGIDMTDRPYLLYFDLTKTKFGKLFVNPFMKRISPKVQSHFKSVLTKDSFLPDEDPESATTLMICVHRCPDHFMLTTQQFKKYQEETQVNICTYNTNITPKSGQDTVHGPCPSFVLPTTPIMHRCIPIVGVAEKGLKAVGNLLRKIDIDVFGFSRKLVSDVHSSWKHLVIICLFALVLSFIMMLCLGIITQITVYIVGAAILCVSLLMTCWTWYVYYVERTQSNDIAAELGFPSYTGSEKTLLTIAIITTCAAILAVCLVLFLRKSVSLMVTFFKEVGVAMATIPSLLVVPPVCLVFVLSFVCGWFIIAIFIYTASKPAATPFGTVTYTQPSYTTYVWVYYVIGLFWGVQFLIAGLEMVLAGAFAEYYSKEEETMLSLPLMKSFWRMLRYHLGSLALGSLILTITRILRYLIKLVTKTAQRNAKHSLIADFICKCCNCFFWCLEKFLKFVNTNVYIQIASQGDSFCQATRHVFNILLNNPTHFVVIKSIGSFFLLLAKLVVTVLSFVVGYYLLKTFDCEHITEIIVPVLIGSLIAYVIAYVFFYVFEVGVNTFIVCYCYEKHSQTKLEEAAVPNEEKGSFRLQATEFSKDEIQMIRKTIARRKVCEF